MVTISLDASVPTVMPQNRCYLPAGQRLKIEVCAVLFRAAETSDIDLFVTCQRPKACLPRALDSPDQHAQEDSEPGENNSELCDLYITCLTLAEHGLNISLLLLNRVHKKVSLTVDLCRPVISGPFL